MIENCMIDKFIMDYMVMSRACQGDGVTHVKGMSRACQGDACQGDVSRGRTCQGDGVTDTFMKLKSGEERK